MILYIHTKIYNICEHYMSKKSKSKNVEKHHIKKCMSCNENMRFHYITCPRCGTEEPAGTDRDWWASQK